MSLPFIYFVNCPLHLGQVLGQRDVPVVAVVYGQAATDVEDLDVLEAFKVPVAAKRKKKVGTTLAMPLLTHSFLPAGQFFAPKLIILIKCLIDILFFKVLF